MAAFGAHASLQWQLLLTALDLRSLSTIPAYPDAHCFFARPYKKFVTVHGPKAYITHP